MSSTDTIAIVRGEILVHIPAQAPDFEDMVRAGAEIVDAIAATGQRGKGLAELSLDDLVCDAMGDGEFDGGGQDGEDDPEADGAGALPSAADVNGRGLAAQVACIIALNGLAEGLRMVRAATGLLETA